jgi:hypothetical protein
VGAHLERVAGQLRKHKKMDLAKLHIIKSVPLALAARHSSLGGLVLNAMRPWKRRRACVAGARGRGARSACQSHGQRGGAPSAQLRARPPQARGYPSSS